MTKKIFTAVACLGTVLGFASTRVAAQTMETVRVNLPVATKVGDVNLPAGEYSIRELNNSTLEISSESHRGMNAFVNAKPVVSPNNVEHTKVILRKSENGYQIQTIWLEGQDMGFELTSAAE